MDHHKTDQKKVPGHIYFLGWEVRNKMVSEVAVFDGR
jgi:hypothetical protein